MHPEPKNPLLWGILPLQKHILFPVIHMNNSQEVLTSLLKAAQLSQTGIRSVLDQAMAPELSGILKHQLRELNGIESEARALASQRGWELEELDPAVRMMADMMTRIKLPRRNVDSGIADMMIQGNTKGMIKSIQNLHRFNDSDAAVRTISQKLLDCETANIRQMQEYL